MAGKPTLPYYFSVSKPKLAILSFCTLGIYQIYWFYHNWWLHDEREKENIFPLIRSLFPMAHCYFLFQDIQATAKRQQIPVNLDLRVITAGYIALTLALFFVPIFPALLLLAQCSVFLLWPIQDLANQVNHKVTPSAGRNYQMTPLNFLALAVGSVLWSFVMLVIFAPFVP